MEYHDVCNHADDVRSLKKSLFYRVTCQPHVSHNKVCRRTMMLTSLAAYDAETGLLSVDSDSFRDHLASRSDEIKKVITAIYSNAPTASPDVQALQRRVNELLAQEKGYINQAQKLTNELESVNKQLEDASFRYMVAERKLDKAKSTVVANIEKQGTMGSTVIKPESEEKVNGEAMNGIKTEVSTMATEEAERERAEAVAVATKAKEQLAQLEEQNSKLTKELTTAKTRLASLTDEDYAGTELFKIMKSQLEESLNKVNDLEAIHIKLRDEAKQAQAERTAYRMKIDEEAMASTSSTEQLLAVRDADLQRIRAARDESHYKALSLENAVHDHKATAESATALANARADRITALENEVERLRTRCGELHAEVTEEDKVLGTVPELQQKIADLRQECRTLEGELPSIEQAYKKAQAAAAAKFSSYEQMDQQLAGLKSAKARADQKYFGMMKIKETLEGELATLRKSDKTAAGIITSLKSAEDNTKALNVNLDRQVAEHLASIQELNEDKYKLEAKANQASLAATGFQKQIVGLKELLNEKDTALTTSDSSKRELEQNVASLTTRQESLNKEIARLKKDAGKNDSQEVKNLRVGTPWRVSRDMKLTCA